MASLGIDPSLDNDPSSDNDPSLDNDRPYRHQIKADDGPLESQWISLNAIQVIQLFNFTIILLVHWITLSITSVR